jgi:3-deoxy-7-phosphoheptulonate synthase
MSSVCQSRLKSIDEVDALLPIPAATARFVQRSRASASKILRRESSQVALILGPCSIHNLAEALDYGQKVAKLQTQLKHFFLIMRVFIEKPRTRLGWKGFLYDPYLDGSNDLQEGILLSRKLLLALNALGVPCATEFLDPLVAPYLAGLMSWGVIGARTAASQPHRQMASGLPFPIGFKNSIQGELETALSGILTAKMPHAHCSIDPSGHIAAVQTTGNPLAHLVLRGSNLGSNYDRVSIEKALLNLRAHHLEERLVIDCAHGNSGKDPHQQRSVFNEVVDQILKGNKAICALMLESHLATGKQPFPDEPGTLRYGVSITDPCLGWAETEELALEADALLSTTMSSVQK